MSDSKILSSKIVYSSTYFKINHVQIERDGKTFEKDIIEENPIVIVLPYTNNDEIYLASEYRDTFGKVILNCIGGKIDQGDELLTAAKKELREEAGLLATKWRHVSTWETAANIKRKINVFFATDLQLGNQHLEEDEKIEVVKLSLIEALNKIEKEEIPVGADIAAILLFDRLRREGKL